MTTSHEPPWVRAVGVCTFVVTLWLALITFISAANGYWRAALVFGVAMGLSLFSDLGVAKMRSLLTEQGDRSVTQETS